jgi:hypothetical protein
MAASIIPHLLARPKNSDPIMREASTAFKPQVLAVPSKMPWAVVARSIGLLYHFQTDAWLEGFMGRAFRVLLLVVLLPRLGAAGAEEKQKLAVMNLRVDTSLPKGMDKTLNEILLTEFHRSARFEVLGTSDIAALLQMEEQKVMLGSCDDDSCLAELGGALGVAWMAVPSIGAVGERYVINLKLLDVSKAKVLSRVNEYVDREEDKIISGLTKAVQHLLGSLGGPIAVPPAAETTAIDVAPWVTLGLGVVAAGAGGVLGGLAMQDDKAAADAVQGSAEWNDHHDAAGQKALIADVMFGVAGAAALTTLILFLIDGDAGPEATVTVGVPPGSLAGFGLRF